MKKMRIKHKIAVGATALAVSLSGATSAAADSLAAVLTDAYNNSGLLEQNRALLRAADEDVAVAMAALRPIVSWSASLTRSFSRLQTSPIVGPSNRASTTSELGVLIEQTLLDGGVTKLSVDVAKESVLATRQGLVSLEQRVLLLAIQSYINIRTNSEIVSLRQNNVRVIEEELKAAKDRFDVGEVTRTDVAQAEARLAEAKAALASAQGDLATAREAFIASVGRRPGALAAPPAEPQTAKSVTEAKAIALRTHPDVRQAQHQVAATDIQVQIATASTNPRVSVQGRYGLSETFDTTNFTKGGSISLNVAGPIYRGGQLAALRRQAIARRDAQRAALHVASLGVAEDAGAAFASLQVAKAARVASDRAVRFATVAFRGVREEATLGARTTLDVLNAEQELLDARARLISASGVEFLASYQLLASMGLLTADHLRLKVTKYDPAEYYKLVKSAPAPISKQGRQLEKVLKSLGKE